LLPILGSIRHPDKLLDVMKPGSVDTVYHAAAYKHVPMVEHNIAEGCTEQCHWNTQHCSGCVAVGRFELRSDLH
jgi:FlaA1/EpsC-like NDP-sugar epimerase